MTLGKMGRASTGKGMLPLKVTLGYAMAGVLWILFSDWVLAFFFPQAEHVTRLQSAKGLGFIAFTAVVLFAMLRRYMNRLAGSQEEIRERERMVRQLMEQASDAILLCNERGNLLEVNEAACRMLGYPRDELVRLNAADLLPEDELVDDPPQIARLRAGETIIRDRRLKARDGTVVHVEVSSKMLPDGRLQAFLRDTSARRQAERVLARRSHELDLRIREMNVLYAVARLLHGKDPDPNAWERLVRLLPEALQHPDAAVARIRIDGRTYATEGFLETRWKLVADVTVRGERRGTVEVRYLQERPPADEGPFLKQEREFIEAIAGHVGEFIVMQETEDALRAALNRFQAVVEACPLPIIALDAERRVLLWNPAAERTFGSTGREMIGQPYLLVPPDLREAFVERFEREMAGECFQEETQRYRKDGTLLDVFFTSAPLRDASGRIMGSVGILQDISQQKRAAERLRLLSAALQAAANAVVITDLEGSVTWVNPAFTQLTGYSFQEAVGQNILELQSGECEESFYRELWDTIRAGRVWRGELSNRRKDGSLYFEEQTITPVLDETGRPTAFIGVKQDITLRREAERALAESEERFRALVQRSSDIVTIIDAGGIIRYASPSVQSVLGRLPEDLVGQSALRHIHPEDVDAIRNVLRRMTESPAPTTVSLGYRCRHADGSWIWIESVGSNDASDVLHGFVINSRDVSDRKRLENDLRQAQKMEAVGRLAGGIAHDFNNLLMAIGGYSELLLENLPESDPRRADVLEIISSTERAAALVRQLLAFSRQREQTREVTDVNASIQSRLRLLELTLGKQGVLSTDLAPDLMLVMADPSQLEQVLLNLVINARDAMPNGGEVKIETRNVLVRPDEPHAAVLRPGRYVRISVSDTGIGMSDDLKSRIFEPFFTTKDEGRGSGLGLATVYAVVEEHEGHVEVSSEPGHGATFHIYLPARTERPAMSLATGPDLSLVTPLDGLKGNETVLLLEDEAPLRKLATHALQSYGYEVLAAGDAQQALHLFHDNRERVALLLSDVIMPGVSGPTLYRQMRAEAPQLKALFMSGYARGLSEDPGTGSATPMLQKPFSLVRLARSVREVLDS
jgi:two-component system cell cycle sensor histidine kinase/response regulator CckA